MKVGDNLIKLNANFRIYFNTREANPSLDPVVFSKTTVIDCTMTAQVNISKRVTLGSLKLDGGNSLSAGAAGLANQGRN